MLRNSRSHAVVVFSAMMCSIACGARFEKEDGRTSEVDGGSEGGSTQETGGRGGGSGGRSGGGTSGDGGTAAGGLPSTGGAFGAGGLQGVGGATCLCPGAACAQPGFWLNVQAAGVMAGAGITDVSVEGAGLDFECQPSGGASCQWSCNSNTFDLKDGRYSFIVRAPGYEPSTVRIDVENPVDCGCCGCCPPAYFETVNLRPSGPSTPECCADLTSDQENCGACGHACSSSSQCVAGKCSGECTRIDGELEKFVAGNRECEVDDDCTTVQVGCAPIRMFCEGSAYLRKDHDSARLSELLNTWQECSPTIDCAICDALTPPPACTDGVCAGAF